MKKVLLTLVLGVFAFGASGFDTLQNEPDEEECATMAWQFGSSMPEDASVDQVMAVMDFIYGNCIEGNNFMIMVIGF